MNYWTFERCKEKALKYKSRNDFVRGSRGAYDAAWRQRWLDKICRHMEEIIKPKGYWTFEQCHKVALTCKTRKEFRKKYSGAYAIAERRGWLKDICKHMIQILKLPNYWTKEKCHAEALKCKNKSQFREKYGGAYFAALRKGWLDKICSHMQIIRRQNGYWTFERCQEAALKCKSRKEFSKKFRGAYSVSSTNGWLNKITSHIEPTDKPDGFWTKENLQLEALKYKSRSDFSKHASGAYTIAGRNDFLDEICSHMESHGNRYKRMVYVYEFPDNHVYVGLTYNAQKRNSSHHEVGPVFNHSKRSNHRIPSQQIISNFIPAKEAAILEEKTKQDYMVNGWVILNKAKTGSLGGNIYKWTKEKCYNAALLCKTRNEFLRKSPGAYGSAYKNGWLDDICKHMIQIANPPNYWTKQRCHQVALKFKTRQEFRKAFSGAYISALKNGWLIEITKHMPEIRKPRHYWTLELCREAAKKYETRREFRKKSPQAYDASTRGGWMDKICGQMKLEWRIRPVLQLTKDNKPMKKFGSIKQAAREIGVNATGISSCCSGREKTAYGFKWKYAD